MIKSIIELLEPTNYRSNQAFGSSLFQNSISASIQSSIEDNISILPPWLKREITNNKHQWLEKTFWETLSETYNSSLFSQATTHNRSNPDLPTRPKYLAQKNSEIAEYYYTQDVIDYIINLLTFARNPSNNITSTIVLKELDTYIQQTRKDSYLPDNIKKTINNNLCFSKNIVFWQSLQKATQDAFLKLPLKP